MTREACNDSTCLCYGRVLPLCSPVNDLLDRGDYTLSEIFDEDDLLQVRIMTICCEPLPFHI
jgi:hypothetical protein